MLLLALNIRSGDFGVSVYCYVCCICGVNGCLCLVVPDCVCCEFGAALFWCV